MNFGFRQFFSQSFVSLSPGNFRTILGYARYLEKNVSIKNEMKKNPDSTESGLEQKIQLCQPKIFKKYDSFL